MTLCKVAFTMYPVIVDSSFKRVQCPAEQRRKEVELAVAIKSAGAWDKV
jgi:hypothetical protein